MLSDAGFVDIEIGLPVDTFGDARGEANARTFEVYGHAFVARWPGPARTGSNHHLDPSGA